MKGSRLRQNGFRLRYKLRRDTSVFAISFAETRRLEAEKQKTKWMVEVNYSDSKIDLLNCDCRTIDIKVPVFISL